MVVSAFGLTLVDDADVACARTTLGVDVAGTDNSTDVTIVVGRDYISITGQELTLGAVDLSTDVTGTLPVANGGTGATDVAGIKSSLDIDHIHITIGGCWLTLMILVPSLALPSTTMSRSRLLYEHLRLLKKPLQLM